MEGAVSESTFSSLLVILFTLCCLAWAIYATTVEEDSSGTGHCFDWICIT